MKKAATTIYALASASGKAGVAVVRISGPDAAQVASLLGFELPAPRLATLAALAHGAQAIDRALVLWFPGPASFTGEDVLELHLHGSRAALRLLFDAFAASPALRLAEPGEFARRAFMGGKLDLAQAEGLADLIDAETQAQHRQALRQLGGEAAARLAGLREAILTPLALLEATIDFPDEEIPAAVLDEAQADTARAADDIAALLDDGAIGEKIREGLEVVIFGPPNVGKSTLINRLARRDIAIVSPEPGTTRDLIEAHLDIGGYAVTLVDTAGLREAEGIEGEGIRRAGERLASADLRLCLLSADAAMQQYTEMKGQIDDNTLIIINKTDLAPVPALPVPAISLSLINDLGVDVLSIRAHISQKMGVPSLAPDYPPPAIARRFSPPSSFSANATSPGPSN
ncbi:MAG: tRNA uridine-5-carboxymethylaminomethyl(34) synthesis GTPase MnmE [Alphaproteobacteria bacterium]